MKATILCLKLYHLLLHRHHQHKMVVLMFCLNFCTGDLVANFIYANGICQWYLPILRFPQLGA